MKFNRGTGYYNNNLSFIDMLFNIIMIFVLLFFVVVMLMNPPENKKKDIDAKAEMLIVMTWPDNSPHDIDLWVLAPLGPPIFYSHTENSYMHLDIDDRGADNNWIGTGFSKKTLPIRREVITFRGLPDGRFVINTHFFSAKDEDAQSIRFEGDPIPVTVEVIKINPQYQVLVHKEVQLIRVSDVAPVAAFIIRDNEITDIVTEDVENFIYQSWNGEQR